MAFATPDSTGACPATPRPCVSSRRTDCLSRPDLLGQTSRLVQQFPTLKNPDSPIKIKQMTAPARVIDLGIEWQVFQ